METPKKLIDEQLQGKRSLLQDKKKMGRQRELALEEQLRLKKQRVNYMQRRIKQMDGEKEKGIVSGDEVRIQTKILRDSEQEIRALENELKFVRRDNDIEGRILEQEIRQLEAERKLCTAAKHLRKSDEFDLSGDYALADEEIHIILSG